MSKPIIEAHNLGIQFVRNRRRQLRLREMFIHRGGRQPKADEFWPLRNVSFEVQPGDAVGVIGRNGTGKSTLLRLIAGVLIQDEGTITVRGEVAPCWSSPPASPTTSPAGRTCTWSGPCTGSARST